MRVAKTKMQVLSVEAKKENATKDDGAKRTSHIDVEFTVPKSEIEELFPVSGFMDQFFSGEDVRLEVLHPIKYHQAIEDLLVEIDFGSKQLKFEASRIASGMSLTPQVGGFVQVQCKIKLYPANKTQSGELDDAVKEFVFVTISPMTEDAFRDKK